MYLPFYSFAAFLLKLEGVQRLALVLAGCLQHRLLGRLLVVDLVHEVVVRRRMAALVAAPPRRRALIWVTAAEVHLLVDVLDTWSGHGMDCQVPVAAVAVVGQVIDRLSFHHALHLPTALGFGADKSNEHGASRQEQQHQGHSGPDGHPRHLGATDRCVLGKKKLAVPSAVTWHAGAHISIVSFVAGGAIVARVVFASANGGTAVAAGVPWWAGAGVSIGSFLTRPAVLARVCRALISGVVTVHPSETIGTLAQVGVDEIHAVCT